VSYPIAFRLAALLVLAAAPARAADFTLVTVGDLIQGRPVSMLANPGALPQWQAFADTRKLLTSGDITYGNLETTILDVRSFKGSAYAFDGDIVVSSVPAVASDLKAMGISIVSRANNHALDWGTEGMRESTAHIGQEKLIGAGAGETLDEATKAGFVQTPAGRIAIVSMASTFRPTTNALPVTPEAPYGRPGVNGLDLSASAVLDTASYSQLHDIACSFEPSKPCSVSSSITLFGTTVRAAREGETPFTYDYEVNPDDRERVANAVATAKSDGAKWVIATIHAHESLTDDTPPRSWSNPAAFLRPLAHHMIDSGADVFVATGIHHVAGIEIYKGKPIFYGHSNFFWSGTIEPISGDVYETTGARALLARSFEHQDRVTDSDYYGLRLAGGHTWVINDKPTTQNRSSQSFVARSVFDANGRIKEIRLFPIEFGYGDKLTRFGVPRRAEDEIANFVLDRVIAMSKDRGVAIAKVREGGYLIGVATPLRATE
jgi:poly-gamma-glutamate synthesis protein (capsule biosynthesis protein)